jgi:hypothetical protein
MWGEIVLRCRCEIPFERDEHAGRLLTADESYGSCMMNGYLARPHPMVTVFDDSKVGQCHVDAYRLIGCCMFT